MARQSREFTCQSCGALSAKWAGRCDSCGGWNSIVEEVSSTSGIAAGPVKSRLSKGRIIELQPLSGTDDEPDRIFSGIDEFDRVAGGGLVPGSAVLVGGDPGIGKSTLMLQVVARLAKAGHVTTYISGEEAIAQVRLRAERLGLADATTGLAAETNLSDIITTLEAQKGLAAVVIDSIQTIWSSDLEAAPGTVSQVRSGAQALIRFAKAQGVVLFLVGHVTKEGQIAGPRVLEHMVDTVLYFEGERGHIFRILRAVKNRFGPTDEIGVFEMTGKGLSEVTNPSELFLSDRDETSPGSAVYAGIEGTRPLLVEIQALAVSSPLGTPRRAVIGWDSSRLAMILAVLEAHCQLSFAGIDVYLNVAGGLKLHEPAVDLAVAAALISSLTATPLPPRNVYFGEISLAGAVRSIPRAETRLKEAAKLGFTSATLPVANAETIGKPPKNITLHGVSGLAHLAASLVSTSKQQQQNDSKENIAGNITQPSVANS